MSQERHPTLIEDGESVLILDQTRLPREAVMLRLATLEDVAHAIRVMQVRGAPLIGATAAYGVALGLTDDAGDARLVEVIDTLAATRPTAVNLHWALARMRRVLQESALATRRQAAWNEARAIATEDKAANAKGVRVPRPPRGNRTAIPPAPFPGKGVTISGRLRLQS
ncbi:MAG: methylthioribose-1-phosphate isomerase [Rhodocyclaceae bacterium]|nr:MAG: methylthioribose-1-phosphate isomerase [Rhodocyclaceae bacterium]